MKTLKTSLQISLLLVLLMPFIAGAQNSVNGNCITFDFCNKDCDENFHTSLKSLNLKKGDFFSVKILHINPYRYNIKVTTKNDTFKIGKQPALFTDFMDLSKLGEIAANIGGALASVALPTGNEAEKNEMVSIVTDGKKKNNPVPASESKESTRDQTEKMNLVNAYITRLEGNYEAISECYYNSGLFILNSNVDCFNTLENKDCFLKFDCKCLKYEFSKRLDSISAAKQKAKTLLNELIIKAKGNETLIASYNKLLAELNSDKFNAVYLNSVHAKTYSNFLIADNAANLSTYYSMPIQVQGDYLELKIDITPKSAAGGKEEKKEEEKKSGDSAGVKINNQSPLTINISTAEKAAAAAAASTDTTKKTTEESSKDVIAADALKFAFPEAFGEWHLSYKYRTGDWFFGVSSGFFVDWLQDANYTNKPVDPLSSTTQYYIVQENNASKNKYGSFTSFNVGRYWSSNSKGFFQMVVGPGLTIETKVQPRLLFGFGIGGGEQHKISINCGFAFGEVRKLSNAFDLKQAYAVPQENLYYSSLGIKGFISVGYIYNLQFN